MSETADVAQPASGTLDSLMDGGDSSSRPCKVFVAHNLGNRSFLMTVPMHEFHSMSIVANERGALGEPAAQRKLDDTHAQKLASYILKGLISAAISRRGMQGIPPMAMLAHFQSVMGKQPFVSLQPIVANIRNCTVGGSNLPAFRMTDRNTNETACFKVMLSQKDVLYVVDGQHRRRAMDLVFAFLDAVRTTQKYPKRGGLFPTDQTVVLSEELEAWNECMDVARAFCSVAVEVHLGLSIEEERQLFHDLNKLAKKVEPSLALQFDSSNPVNLYIKETLLPEILGWEADESDSAQSEGDSGRLTRKDLVGVCAHLFLNKSNIAGASPSDVEARREIANRFWTAVAEVDGFGVASAKLKTVAAQPVVLKALAKLVFDFAFGRRKSAETLAHLETLIAEIPRMDLSHGNPMWRFYELSVTERATRGLEGLHDFLPSDDEGFNRDIGKFDEIAGVMRFGVRHNDIFPILGDMIRWRLGLPNRNFRFLS